MVQRAAGRPTAADQHSKDGDAIGSWLAARWDSPVTIHKIVVHEAWVPTMSTCRLCGKNEDISSQFIDGVCDECDRAGAPARRPARMTATAYGQGLKNALVCGTGLLIVWLLGGVAIRFGTGKPVRESFGIAFAPIWAVVFLWFFGAWLYYVCVVLGSLGHGSPSDT